VGSSKRSAGRPSKPVLNREMIAQQALELVIDRGLDSLTMTQLSKKLGVAASALYNHVDNKADLVLLIQDALVSQVSLKGMLGLIDGEVTLTDALEDWARSYRAVFANYPSLIPMIAITPVSDAPQTLRMYNVVAQAIMSAGIPDDAVIRVIVSFESFLFGSALDVNAPSDVLDAGEQSTDSAWLKQAIGAAQAPSEQQQSTRPHAEALGEVRNAYAEPPFQYGLAALIRQTLELVEERV